MNRVKKIAGIVLFCVGFVMSSAQNADGSPAPLVTLAAALVMIIGGKILAAELKEGEE